MRKIAKFWRAPAADKLLLSQCFLLALAVRMGLWTMGFPRLSRRLARFARSGGRRWLRSDLEPTKVAWAVGIASRYVPRATCLTQALATKVLLERLGRAVTLRIGVAKNARGRFEAHAWVEVEGRIVIGEVKDLQRFASLPPLEFESA